MAKLDIQLVYGAELKARLTGSAGTLESVITNFELEEGLNRFRLAWDTHSLKNGEYVIQISVTSQGRRLLSVSSRRLIKRIKKVVKGIITRPAPLSTQLKRFDPYIAKYAVENVIKRICEVPYDKEKSFRFVVFSDRNGKSTPFGSIAENINAEEPLVSLFVLCLLA